MKNNALSVWSRVCLRNGLNFQTKENYVILLLGAKWCSSIQRREGVKWGGEGGRLSSAKWILWYFYVTFLKVFADISANVELCHLQGGVGLKEPTFKDLKFLEEQNGGWKEEWVNLLTQRLCHWWARLQSVVGLGKFTKDSYCTALMSRSLVRILHFVWKGSWVCRSIIRVISAG